MSWGYFVRSYEHECEDGEYNQGKDGDSRLEAGNADHDDFNELEHCSENIVFIGGFEGVS